MSRESNMLCNYENDQQNALFFFFRCDPTRVMASFLSFSRSHRTTHHSRQDSSGRVISSSQRPLYLTTHNTHNRQTSMPPVGFEPTISAGERPQTYEHDALYRLIYYSTSSVHVSGDVFAHHQEHQTVFTVSGSVHPSCWCPEWDTSRQQLGEHYQVL